MVVNEPLDGIVPNELKEGGFVKKSLVAFALVLGMILGVFGFASCGKSEETPAATTPGTDAATSAVTAAATGAETAPSTDAATAPATSAVTAAATGAATDAVTEAAANAATSTLTEPATDAATDAATDPVTEPETEPDTEPATTVDPELKWEEIAPQLTRLAERDRKLKIECSVGGSAEKMSKNNIYLAGPDSITAGETPVIQVMIYERNQAASALFNTTVEYEFWDLGFGEQAAPINTVVHGNDPDAPDLFVNMLNDLNKELRNGSFKDVWAIPNGYFDFSTDGWLWEWMKNLSFSGDRGYILGGDYFLDVMRAISIIPFNMTMMDANADKLAKAILEEGEELDPDENLTLRFFDLVEEGGWTWDVLGKLCTAIWFDKDGDNQDSIDDVLGIIADGYGGINAASFVYSCGEKLTETYIIEDASNPYNGKQWIKYADDLSGLNRIFDCVKSVFEGSGSLTTSYPFSGNTADKPGAAYHHTKFAASELLFAGVCTLGMLEDDTFQLMTDLFSVVPCPKTDVEKQYNTIIINQGDVGAINVNANSRKTRVLSAYVQYCTEHSTAIREEFLQIVTKYKTTTYDQGTDRMLDLIYEGIIYGRDYTVDGENEEPRWHRLMMGQQFVAGSSYITEMYEKNRSPKQDVLDKLMAKWYTLPKGQ